MGIERFIKALTEGRPNGQFTPVALRQLETFVIMGSKDVGTGAFVGIGNGKINNILTSDIIPSEISMVRGKPSMICHWRLDTAINKAGKTGQARQIKLLGVLIPSGEKRIDNGMPLSIVNSSPDLTPGLKKYFSDFLEVTRDTLGRTIELIATAGLNKENKPFAQLYRAKHVCDPGIKTEKDIDKIPRQLIPLAA